MGQKWDITELSNFPGEQPLSNLPTSCRPGGIKKLWPEKDGNDVGFSRPTCWDLKALNTPMHLWLHNHSLVKLHPQVCMHI